MWECRRKWSEKFTGIIIRNTCNGQRQRGSAPIYTQIDARFTTYLVAGFTLNALFPGVFAGLYLLRKQRLAGSNPAASTNYNKGLAVSQMVRHPETHPNTAHQM